MRSVGLADVSAKFQNINNFLSGLSFSMNVTGGVVLTTKHIFYEHQLEKPFIFVINVTITF